MIYSKYRLREGVLVLEKIYEIPNYMLTMLRDYKEGIKYGNPSLDEFLDKKSEYGYYADLIKEHTDSNVDFKAIAGKFLIDGAVTGYTTEFDELLVLIDSINQQLDEFVAEANKLGEVSSLKITSNYFGSTSQKETVSQVALHVLPEKYSDSIEIYTYAYCSPSVNLLTMSMSSVKSDRTTAIRLKTEQGCIEFNGLNADRLYTLTCSHVNKGKATQYMKERLFNPEFRKLISTLNDTLYRIYQRENNPMDILIK